MTGGSQSVTVVVPDVAGIGQVVDPGPYLARMDTGTSAITDILRVRSVPVCEVVGSDEPIRLAPPVGGVVVRMCTFAPDSERGRGQDAVGAALRAMGGVSTPNAGEGGEVGMHRTPTIDVVTVVSGRLRAVLHEKQLDLEVGASLVQFGAPHAWSNPTDEPATAVITMISAHDGPASVTSNFPGVT